MTPETPTITIRDIESVAQMKTLEKLQQDVWGWDDLDTTPLMDFIILKELGGTLIGAFDGEHLIGFAFGFVGLHEERVVFHSHMLAVHPDYREHGIGLRLKLAQRASALERGFEHITWTFDPLQSTNGHLNFHKLGVVASEYKVNFYGDQSSSPLHRYIGTDRLWVDWFLNSKRVANRVKAAEQMNDEAIANVDRLDGLIIEVPTRSLCCNEMIRKRRGRGATPPARHSSTLCRTDMWSMIFSESIETETESVAICLCRGL
jgi:predicted GNAT superfamily acetyltransferase